MYRRALLTCLVLNAGAALAAGLTDLEMVGRYAELELAAEQKLSALPAPRTSVLGPLCVAHARVKRYGKLFDCLALLERQIAAGDTVLATDKPWVSDSDATPMPNMLRAEALIELGDYRRAADEAKAALAKVQDVLPYGLWPAKHYRISLLSTLSLAHALAGDRAEALEQLRLLEGYPIGFMGSAIIGPLRNNGVARTYAALGDFRKALEFVGEDDGAWRRLTYSLNNAAWGYSGDDQVESRVVLPKLLLRAKCLSETGALDEAKTALDAMLRHAHISDQGGLYWQTLYERGRIAEREGKAPDAISFLTRAIEVIEQQRTSINTEANKIGFVGDKQGVYRQLVSALLSNNEHARAFEYVERAKSRALVDMLAAKQDFAVAGGDAAKVRELLAQVAKAEADAIVQDATADKSSTRSIAVKARQQLDVESPELASLINGSSLGAAEVQALIPPGETLIEYYGSDDNLVAFVVTRQTLDVVPLDSRDLTGDIRRFRELIQDADSDRYLDMSKSLHERLIAPLASRLGSGKLLIVAHGPLHYLPFNALHDGRTFLIERHSLRLLPSASILKYVRGQPVAKAGEILAFGNPDLGDPRLDLANAQAEATAITQGRPQSKALLRKDASEGALRRYGDGFRYIHFATHGEFNAAAPLRSALRLAQDPQGDGLLTVDKLYSLKLDADLVTLSACETGVGKIASGDDVVGLTRGFLYAGSRSIVASLWQVDDLATSHLMTRFYEHLKRGDKREALRQAQRETMKQYPHPYFWAAFQLIGNAE